MAVWKRVLCSTDLSPAADEAVLQAHRAAADGAELILLHVVSSTFQGAPMTPDLVQKAMVDRERLASGVIEAIVDRARELTGREADALTVVIGDGDPYAVIVAEAESRGADLVVLGAEDASGAMGHVAEHVVRHVHSSVLVARRAGGGGRVLVATDFSPAGAAAVRAGAREAHIRGATLMLVHCVEFATASLAFADTAVAPPSTIEPNALLAEVRASAVNQLSEMARALDVPTDTRVVNDPPETAIPRLVESERADLLVLGTAGRTGLRRVLLGSVAETLLRSVPCAVLVVRGEE